MQRISFGTVVRLELLLYCGFMAILVKEPLRTS